jgi:hypothetical protein
VAASSTSYTSKLWIGTNPSPGTPVSSPVVPVGKLWVVRNITVLSPGPVYSNTGGFAFADSGGNPVFGRANGYAPGAMWFYYEGRFVVQTSEHLTFVGSQPQFTWTVTGYLFNVGSSGG